MAIDKKTGKRKPIGKAAKELEKSKKKIPKYEVNYEEELKKQLFADENKTQESNNDIDFYEDVREFHHQKRDGE